MTDSPAPAEGRLRAELWRWFGALLLLGPVLALYTSDLLRPGPTGLIAYDMVYYVANAREYVDQPGASLGFGNPNSAWPDTPRIYFQPQTLALGLVLGLTHADPGFVFCAWGALAGWGALRVLMSLWWSVAPPPSAGRPWLLPLVAWGGGAYALAALGTLAVSGAPLFHTLGELEPASGWWFQCALRNLVYPTEAYYHLLVWGCLLAVVRRRLGLALGLAALLSAGHPFTGLQLALILVVWAACERWIARAAGPPLWWGAGVGLVLVLHLAYYLVFLPGFPEHRQMVSQWQEFSFAPRHLLLAYVPVAALAAGRIWRDGPRAFLDRPDHRLLLCWCAVSLLLIKHDLLLTPRQPPHFSRGHVWTPLMLIGAPLLGDLLAARAPRRRCAGVLLALLLLLDNAAWFGRYLFEAPPTAIHLSPEMRQVLDDLAREATPQDLVVSNTALGGYLATAYSSARPWYGHAIVTPHAAERLGELRAFFQEGQRPSAWTGRRLFVIRGSLAPDGSPRWTLERLPSAGAGGSR